MIEGDDVPCPAVGCNYHVPATEHWSEEMEQHVRWIHIPSRDFGEKPVPTLFAMLTGGLIKSEEFALFIRDSLQVELAKLDPPVSPGGRRKAARNFVAGTVGAMLAYAGIIAGIFLPKPWAGFPLGIASSGVFFVFLMLLRTTRLLRLTDENVRPESYPDTSNKEVSTDAD